MESIGQDRDMGDNIVESLSPEVKLRGGGVTLSDFEKKTLSYLDFSAIDQEQWAFLAALDQKLSASSVIMVDGGEFSGTIAIGDTINVDTIEEYTTGSGISLTSVTNVDVINEYTANAGTIVEGVHFENGRIGINTTSPSSEIDIAGGTIGVNFEIGLYGHIGVPDALNPISFGHNIRAKRDNSGDFEVAETVTPSGYVGIQMENGAISNIEFFALGGGVTEGDAISDNYRWSRLRSTGVWEYLNAGTPASSGVTNSFQMYAKDLAAGNSIPYFRTENNTEIGLNQSLLTTDTVTHGGYIVADAGYIGSASDTDAMQIEADGDIVFSQDIVVTGTTTLTGGISGGIDMNDSSITELNELIFNDGAGNITLGAAGAVNVVGASGVGAPADAVFLCSWDGADGATSATDESDSAHTINFAGGAELDTAQYKFSTASLLCPGSADYGWCADSADWDFGTGPFTIAFQFRTTSFAAIGTPMSHGGNGSVSDEAGWCFLIQSSTRARFMFYDAGLSLVLDVDDSGLSMNTNQWYHLEVTRDSSNDVRLFLDGTQIGTTQSYAGNMSLGTATMRVGANHEATRAWSGWIDEPLILKGRALHNANFTAPTSPYSGTGTANLKVANNIIIGDAGYIGSTSDTDAIQIEADGDVVFSQDVAITGNITGAAITASGIITDGTWATDGSGAVSGAVSCNLITSHVAAADPHAGYVLESLFDAQTIIHATSDNTPVALVVSEQTIVGRVTGGNITALNIGINNDYMVQVDGIPVALQFTYWTNNGIAGYTDAQAMAALSGGATASFSLNDQALTSVGNVGCDTITIVTGESFVFADGGSVNLIASTVGDPGADTTLVTEQGIREAIDAVTGIAASLFDADTFLYATVDDTPVATSPVNVLAALSGHCGAAFDWNGANFTTVGSVACGAIGCGTITSSGVGTFQGGTLNVGVDLTTGGELHLFGEDAGGSNPQGGVVYLYASDTYDGTVDRWTIQSTGIEMQFKADGNRIMTFDATDLDVDFHTRALVSVGDITTGGTLFSIDTTALSADANTLDDYEEGTWTPALVAHTTNFDSVTYDALAGGLYTKIGNIVYVQGYMRTDAITKGSAAGAIKITGLPFTAAANNAEGKATFVVAEAFNFLDDVPSTGVIDQNSSELFLYFRTSSDGADTNLLVADIDTGANDNICAFSGFYRVA